MIKTMLITEHPEELELNEWYCSFDWCPSQCYCHVKDSQGVSHILYLRWRWSDPWTCAIIRNARNEETCSAEDAEWSGDKFAEEHVQYSDVEHELAKAKLMEIWLKLGR